MTYYDEPARVLRPEIEPGRRVLVISDIHANLPYFHGLLQKVGFCEDDLPGCGQGIPGRDRV